MNRWKMPLWTAEDVEQSLGGAEAPFDATGLSTEKELAGFFEGQSAASAGHAPVMGRNNCAAVSRSSPRGTAAAIMPCSSRNFAVSDSPRRYWPIVRLITPL